MNSPEGPIEQFDPQPLYEQALREHPEFASIPAAEITALISQIAEEIRVLEEVAERETPRLELTPAEAKKIAAIWVLSGVGTYDTPLKETERAVYKEHPWIQWADRARLNHAAILARRVAEAKSGKRFEQGGLGDIEERKKNIKAAIEAYGPDIIYNGTQLENDTVGEVLALEGTVIPEDRVRVIRGTADQPIVNTTDNIKTFKLPRPLAADEELAVVAHAPHLVRVMRIVNQFKPFPAGTKVRLFPLPTPPEAKTTYREMEILGILNYVFRKKEATAEPYPYELGG